MRRSTLAIVFVATAAVAFWACNNTTPTTATTTPATVTDTFSGTLNPNGGQTFNFHVSAAGSVTATLVSISPDATITVGLALGVSVGGACSIVLPNDNATQGTSVPGSANGSGTLCVRVYDVGKLTANEDFTVSVLHP